LTKGSSTVLDKCKYEEDEQCEIDKNKCKNIRKGDTQTHQAQVEKVSSSGTSDVKDVRDVKQQDNDDRSHTKSVERTDHKHSKQSVLYANDKNSDQQLLDSVDTHDNTTQNTAKPADKVGATCGISTSYSVIPLCTFWVRLKEKAEFKVQDEILVEVECLQANNKNDVYQLYQYLQNKILKPK
jgi:hypothetical protein